MSNGDIREPDGEETAAEASAGDPRESGPEATREAMASADPYRLSEDELNEREQQFTGPRKAQGPPLEGEDADEPLAEADVTEEVDETPPPEVAPTG
jgi:hypothetical protein